MASALGALFMPGALCYQLSGQRYHLGVRQLITRIDDDLHEQLKARAAAEGRSMNAYVTDVLTRAVRSGERHVIRALLAREGLLSAPPRPASAPTLEDVLALTAAPELRRARRSSPIGGELRFARRHLLDRRRVLRRRSPTRRAA